MIATSQIKAKPHLTAGLFGFARSAFAWTISPYEQPLVEPQLMQR